MEKITYQDLFEFGGKSPIDKAAKEIANLEATYTKFATSLTNEGTRIAQSQQQIRASLQGLAAEIRAVNLATETGRKGAAKVASDIDAQSRAYDGLKRSQKGVEASNKAVAGSLAELRQQLKADRDALIALGAAANPDKIQALAASIVDTKSKAETLERAVRGVNTVLTAAKGSYNALTAENRKLSVELKNLGDTQNNGAQRTQESIAREQALKIQLAQNTAQLKTYDAQLNQHFRNVGNYAESIIGAVRQLNGEKAALTAQAQALQRATTATNLDAAAQNKLQTELAETKQKLDGVNKKLGEFGEAAGKNTGIGKEFAGTLRDFALQGIVATVGLAALVGGIKAVIGANILYSDQLADVAKTTGLTIDQTSLLADELKKLETRTSLGDLLKISEIGGQLGIAKGDILGFTKAINTASIALQNDFGGDVELIATQLGKINTIFKVSDAVGIETALLDIGSAVNELGAQGAATAPFITDFALRVGAIAKNSGLGLDKVLGLGAAFEEMGFTAEVAGTATNRLLGGLAGKSEKFFAIAKIADANLTLKEFKNMVNNDFNGALQLFLKGLKSGGASTTDFAQLVQSLGLKGSGAVSALTALAKNTELVAEKQKLANVQLDNGNSLATEAAIKNDTLAGSYEKLKNSIINATTGTGPFSQFLKGSLDYITQIVKGNINWIETLKSLTILGGVQGPRIVVNGPTKPIDDYGNAIAANGAAMQKTAAQAEKLQSEFDALSSATNRSGGQDARLREITLELQKALGDSAVVLNKETGRYEVNTAAVDKNIIAKRDEAYTAAQGLAKRFFALDVEREKQLALASAIQERADVEAKLLVAKNPIFSNPNSPATKASVEVERKYSGSTVSRTDIALFDEYTATQRKASIAANAAVEAENAQNIVYGNIQKIMPGIIDVTSLLTVATKTNNVATLDSEAATKADEKAKRAAAKAAKDLAHELDELAKAQYELAKFRVEQKEQRFTRQENNVSNDEQFRTKAAESAAAQRIALAQLEQREKIRIAVKGAKELKNGDAVLAIQRQLIGEQYAARIAEISRDLTKEELAIHNDLLAQLRAIDTQRLETENSRLQLVIDNESAGYDLRTAALQQYVDNSILLAKTVYDAEVLAADGATGKITLALNKMSAAVDAARAKVKPFDSKIANDALGIDYTKDQIALEAARTTGLVTETEYQKKRRDLETQYLQFHLANTQLEKNGTKEAYDEELALAKRNADEVVRLEKEKADKRMRIIEESTQLLGAVGNGLFEIGNAQREQDLAAIQAHADADIAVAGNNEKAKKRIQDDARREEAKIKRKQALAARAEALFNIALSTGVAVARAFAASPETFGLPFSAFALANGVIQAAIVLAKPIPAYAKGTESSGSGPALVGERGMEILEKNGRQKLVTGPTIVNLEAGTKVYNNARTVKMFEERGLPTALANSYHSSERIIADSQRGVSPADIARMVASGIAANFNDLRDVIQNKPGVSLSIDKHGLNTFITQANRNSQIMDARYRRNV